MSIFGAAVDIRPCQSRAPRVVDGGRWVVASGIADNVDIEDLFPFFESKRKGGGEVESINKLMNGVILVAFVEEAGK